MAFKLLDAFYLYFMNLLLIWQSFINMNIHSPQLENILSSVSRKLSVSSKTLKNAKIYEKVDIIDNMLKSN